MDKSKPIPTLTGLRFLAAAAVLLFHYGATFSAGKLPIFMTQFLANGYLGVSIFFILSGFILTYSHQNDLLNVGFVKEFMIARFARIYPVYILALCLALPTLKEPISSVDAILVLSMVQSWTVPNSLTGYLWVTQAWTLSVEMFFYLVFPFLLAVALRLNIITAIVLAVICAILIVVFGIPVISPGTKTIPFGPEKILIPFFRLIEFVFGILLCRLVSFEIQTGKLFGYFVALIMVLIMCFTSDVHSAGAFSVLAGLLILHLSGNVGLIADFLSLRAMILLGGASYALYILQGPIRSLCDFLIIHPLDRFLNPVVTLIFAILAFLFLEQPIRRYLLSAYRKAR